MTEAQKNYEAKKAEAIEILNALKETIESDSPQKIHWGHVGSMGYVVQRLNEASEQA